MTSSEISGRRHGAVLVPMDLEPDTPRRVELAADLADRFFGGLIGVAAQPTVQPLYFEAPTADLIRMVEIEEGRAKEELARAEASFRSLVGNRSNVEWRAALSFSLDHAVLQSRNADLIVATRRRGGATISNMSVDAGDLVMEAGRPVLFVPPEVDMLPLKNVLIAWKDTRESRRAVLDAIPLLKAAEDVLVLTIGEEAAGGRDVVSFLGRHGISAYSEICAADGGRAADQIIGAADTLGAKLVVCGAYGHSRTREWAFGGVTRDLLDHSPICCLMSR